MKSRCVVLSVIVVALTAMICSYVNTGNRGDYYRWYINGNGFRGVLEYTMTDKRIRGTIYGDQIEGYQVGRHVVFYRFSRANQIWTGWIWDGSYSGTYGPMISGTFSHEGENSYPWYGHLRNQ